MKNQNLSWYLKNVDLFKGLSTDALIEISHIVHEKICPKKELLYSPYSEASQIYILKKGEITLYLSRGGKRYILDILGPGSIFGQINPDQKDPDHFAEVTEEAYVCLISMQDFSALVARYPELLMNLMSILSQQIQDYQKKLSHNLMTAEEKVLFCLEDGKNKNTGLLSKWFGNERKMTHAKIAEKTG
ncbi:Crp/Fnr family transcriptional regulator, partial [Candidatus Peregrinibacteria bacterium]|nr:Crp/Fnr family transcriptional regulator [Candidatus Peregrinibacteria bacterium]